MTRSGPSGTGGIPNGTLQVATVGRPHGVKGEMRLVPESGRRERLLGLTRIWLRSAGGQVTGHAVVSLRSHLGAALARIDGIEDRDAAAALTHAEVWALESELPAREPDEFGVDEVVGWEVFDETKRVGEVTGVATNAGRDYFEVNHDGTSVLVPAVKDWLIERDPERRRIVMRLPAGLVDEQ